MPTADTKRVPLIVGSLVLSVLGLVGPMMAVVSIAFLPGIHYVDTGRILLDHSPLLSVLTDFGIGLAILFVSGLFAKGGERLAYVADCRQLRRELKRLDLAGAREFRQLLHERTKDGADD